MKKIKVRATFTESVLGTASANPELHAEFIASKSPGRKDKRGRSGRFGSGRGGEKGHDRIPTFGRWQTVLV